MDKMEKVDEEVNIADLIPIGGMEGGQYVEGKFGQELTARTEKLWKIKEEQAEKLASRVGGKTVNLKLDWGTEWVVVMRPLPYLHIYFFLQLYAPEFENEVRVLFHKKVVHPDVSDINIEDVYDITRLMANALVRAADRIIEEE
jgi:hypothetical protein